MSKKIRLSRRGQPIVLTRNVLAVQVLPDAFNGADEFSISEFKPNKAYKVYGAVWVRYSDGSGVACWLVETERGSVEPKAMCNFRVVEAVPLSEELNKK